jgi:hypothetical protein
MSKENKPVVAASGKGSRVVSCDCNHEYQDSKYGKNRRVANNCKDGKSATCTVCGRGHKWL